MNPAFAIVEVLWLLAGANDAGFLSFWNPRMQRYLDGPSHRLHGAYGHRLGSRPELDAAIARDLRGAEGSHLDQVHAAYEALKHTRHSRQVVLQIWDSALDLSNPEPRSKDIPCNLCSHLLIRDGRLEWLQVMRSNDLIWGTPYNFFQWTCVQEIMAGWLGVDVGPYNHISDSLHVYESHWQELNSEQPQTGPVPINRADLRVASYEAWCNIWGRLITAAHSLSILQTVDELLQVRDRVRDLPVALSEWLVVLTAEALRRRGHDAVAGEIIDGADIYWKTSWLLWAGAASAGIKPV